MKKTIKIKLKKPRKVSPAKKKKTKFYLSWEWRKLRYRVLQKYETQCMCCGSKPPLCRLVVDHIKPRTKFPELELDEDNLQVLCNECNMGKSNEDTKDFRTELFEKVTEVEDYWKDNL